MNDPCLIFMQESLFFMELIWLCNLYN